MVSAVSYWRMSCLALATRASSTLPTVCVTTMAASSPRITTTTMISISVKPRCHRRIDPFILSYPVCGVLDASIIAKGPLLPVTAHTSRMTVARSLNSDGNYGVGLAVAAALLLLPLLGGEALRAAWRYERTAVAAGQWWRLISCHVVHLDAMHALLNTVGLALL